MTNREIILNPKDETEERRHSVIVNLSEIIPIRYKDFSIYGSSILETRKTSNNDNFVKAVEIYGFSEYRTKDIPHLLKEPANARMFLARMAIATLDDQKMIEVENDNNHMLFQSGPRRNQGIKNHYITELPTDLEISNAFIKSETLLSRFRNTKKFKLTPKIMDISYRISEFEDLIKQHKSKEQIYR